jgi:hypothetical protein
MPRCSMTLLSNAFSENPILALAPFRRTMPK